MIQIGPTKVNVAQAGNSVTLEAEKEYYSPKNYNISKDSYFPVEHSRRTLNFSLKDSYMICYTIDGYSGEQKEITSHATAIPNKNIVTIILEAPRTCITKIRSHVQGGMTWNSEWPLSDLVETIEDTPGFLSTFDTREAGYPKIPCIKAVRSVTGYGLKEAKQFVEAMEVLKATISVWDFSSHY